MHKTSSRYRIRAIKVHSNPLTFYWSVIHPNGNSTHYEKYEAAFAYVVKKLKRELKEQVAYSRALKISINLLALIERAFVTEMLKCKCIGITKKQYGWIAGIYERQQKEW
jgi:hypothetical protein